MKKQIIVCIMCMLPVLANAAIPYRVEQIGPAPQQRDGNDYSAFAREHPFYIGGAYGFSVWANGGDGDVYIDGKNSSGFEVMAGYRVTDVFRIDANYIHTNAKYNAFKMRSDSAMLNAIFDARIDSMYRLFRRQMLVPYIGMGAGASWNASDDAHIDRHVTPAAAALAGIGIEFGQRFALDLGYRYMYIFSPKINSMDDFRPAAHQFRAGARVNF